MIKKVRKYSGQGRWFVLLLLSFFVLIGSGAGGAADEKTPAENEAPTEVYLIRIEGPISPGSAGFLGRAIDHAAKANAHALIVELDTPGGLVDSMRTMVKDIMNAPFPVIVYVGPSGAQAASAGVMITLASDVAAMAPGTNIGAAHPVATGGKDIPGEMKKKVVNDMVAFIQGIAKERGRNAGWAKKAVEQSISVTAPEAVQLNVVDLIAESRSDLLRKIDARVVKRGSKTFTLHTARARLVEVKSTLRDRILNTLANPNIAYILMMLGLAGLYFELSHPGTILPGVVGGISLILAFYSFQTLPVNYAGVLLIFLGIVLFILELNVTSFGMLSVGGLISLTLGSLMLFKTPQSYLVISIGVLVPVLVCVGGFFVVLTTLVVRSQVRKPSTGSGGMVGLKGPVKEWKGNSGKVLVHGEWWHADSDEILNPGDRIEVLDIRNTRLQVKKIAPTIEGTGENRD